MEKHPQKEWKWHVSQKAVKPRHSGDLAVPECPQRCEGTPLPSNWQACSYGSCFSEAYPCLCVLNWAGHREMEKQHSTSHHESAWHWARSVCEGCYLSQYSSGWARGFHS